MLSGAFSSLYIFSIFLSRYGTLSIIDMIRYHLKFGTEQISQGNTMDKEHYIYAKGYKNSIVGINARSFNRFHLVSPLTHLSSHGSLDLKNMLFATPC